MSGNKGHRAATRREGLTFTQRQILLRLVQAEGRTVTYRELGEWLWGPWAPDSLSFHALLRKHVDLLRERIGDGAVETDYGVGYRLGRGARLQGRAG